MSSHSLPDIVAGVLFARGCHNEDMEKCEVTAREVLRAIHAADPPVAEDRHPITALAKEKTKPVIPAFRPSRHANQTTSSAAS